jgi:hypothetical protein
MVETADQLATVTLNGRPMSFSHGVLIHALRGWHVALYQIPTRTGRAIGKDCHLVLETTTGLRLTGDVMTEFATAGGEYLLLTGVGLLSAESPKAA